MSQATIQSFKDVGQRYGFRVYQIGDNFVLYAQNTDKRWTPWFRYDPQKDEVISRGNTVHLNLWLHETRPDMTPEKCVLFVQGLNKAFDLPSDKGFRLQDLIDPEDWQGIAKVQNAYQDSRYVTGKLPSLKMVISESEGKKIVHELEPSVPIPAR